MLLLSVDVEVLTVNLIVDVIAKAELYLQLERKRAVEVRGSLSMSMIVDMDVSMSVSPPVKRFRRVLKSKRTLRAAAGQTRRLWRGWIRAGCRRRSIAHWQQQRTCAGAQTGSMPACSRA